MARLAVVKTTVSVVSDRISVSIANREHHSWHSCGHCVHHSHCHCTSHRERKSVALMSAPDGWLDAGASSSSTLHGQQHSTGAQGRGPLRKEEVDGRAWGRGKSRGRGRGGGGAGPGAVAKAEAEAEADANADAGAEAQIDSTLRKHSTLC